MSPENLSPYHRRNKWTEWCRTLSLGFIWPTVRVDAIKSETQVNKSLPELTARLSCLRSVWWRPSGTAFLLTKVWRHPNLAVPFTTSWTILSSVLKTQSLRSPSSMKMRVRMSPLPSEIPLPSHRHWLGYPSSHLPRSSPMRTTTPWTASSRYTRTSPDLDWFLPTQQACHPVLGAPCTAWRPHSEAPDCVCTVFVFLWWAFWFFWELWSEKNI